MQKVLILGAGMVVKPMVEYLLEKGFAITIASPMKERADEMIDGHPSGKSVDWSMDDPATLKNLIKEHDLTVSLLPYIFHADVARVCLGFRKPLVTTSYVQPAIQDMNNEAIEAGVLLLNEVGLDPGIDHMSAMRIIDQVHANGGSIEEFYSICGALPAREAANNPLGYKFSWSPKGVVLASRNSALYLKEGKRVLIDPVNLFKDRFGLFFEGVGQLEVYPNRDSISYIDIYGIPETKTMYRGTFRFPGWCETLDMMKELNMLDGEAKDYSGMSWNDFLAERGGTRERVAKSRRAMESFEWLGLFSDEPMGYTKTSPFEITSDRMISKMMIGSNERDMVVLQHIFVARNADGTREVIKSGMVDYGTPATNTSIARTVALPAAIAVRLILEKKIVLSGVYRPVVPEIYNPVLDELDTLGIKMVEKFGLPLTERI